MERRLRYSCDLLDAIFGARTNPVLKAVSQLTETVVKTVGIHYLHPINGRAQGKWKVDGRTSKHRKEALSNSQGEAADHQKGSRTKVL